MLFSGMGMTYSIDRYAKASEYDKGCLCPRCILTFECIWRIVQTT